MRTRKSHFCREMPCNCLLWRSTSVFFLASGGAKDSYKTRREREKSMISLHALDPGLRDAALQLDAAVRQSGLQGRFTSTLRTRAEQTRLYRRFLAGGSQFPAVPPGASAHEYGLAFDYVVSPYEVQPQLGAMWLSWGGGWA